MGRNRGSPPVVTSPPTLQRALTDARSALQPSPTAALDARLLLAQVLSVSPAWILAHDDKPLTVEVERRYQSLIGRRQAGEPMAYLRGSVEWYGDEFCITSDVLIPRPETELLLEQALEMVGRPSPPTPLPSAGEGSGVEGTGETRPSVSHARRSSLRCPPSDPPLPRKGEGLGVRAVGGEGRPITVADIGTGSGVLAVELAKHLPLGTRIIAVDISPAALRVTDRNIARHSMSDHVETRLGSLLTPLTEEPDLIVANLPYLSDEMMETLDRDVLHEPEVALRGGATGLELYAALLGQVRDRGWGCPILFEIDPRQSVLATELVRKLLPGRSIEIELDYAGLARIVVLRPQPRP